MFEALKQAQKAEKEEEIPVGAVVVCNDKIISKAYNQKETKKNSLYHAEIIAMNKACQIIGEKYLTNCDVYVTLEPCAMCAGAMLNYRVRCLYIGARDPKGGCCGSIYNLLHEKRFNHKVEIVEGILEEECSLILKDFFQKRRKKRQ